MDTTAERTPATEAVELATRTPRQLELSPLSEAGQPDESLPYLTSYCRRAHDRALRSVVEAAAQGKSGMRTLVGGPATGKKRALWEATHIRGTDGQLLLYGWRIWPALSPRSIEELLASANRFQEKTVVLLLSAERYLFSDDNEKNNDVADFLRNLLEDAGRAPILILASLLSEYWQSLTAPQDGGVDRSSVELLLRGTSDTVAGSFSATEVQRALGSSDPRVSEAAADAPNGQVIQTIVAGPALRTRCQRISPAARAILDFVVEARHAGHGPSMSRAMLRLGAQACPDGPETDEQFGTALKELTTPVRGGATVLVKDGKTDACRLAPGLDRQYVAEAAQPILPRASLWPVLLETVAGQDSLDVARECRRRHLLELSTHFFLKSGLPEARLELAAMLAKAGRIDEAVVQYRMLTRIGADVEEAINQGAAVLFAAGREKDVLDWLSPLAEAGDRSAALHVETAHTRCGRPELALAVHRRRAENGDLRSAAYVAASMVSPEISVDSHGRLSAEDLEKQRNRRRKELDKAVRWLNELAARHGRDLLPLIADLTMDAFGIDAVLEMLEAEATGYDRHSAYLLGAEALSAAGQAERALKWVEAARLLGVPGTAAAATRVNLRARLLEAAQKCALEAADEGDAAPLIEVGDVFARSVPPLPDRAFECYDVAASGDPAAAFSAGARTAARLGMLDRTIRCFRGASLAGRAPDPVKIVRLLCAAEKSAEALEWYVATVPPDPGSLGPVARHVKDFPHAVTVAEAVRSRRNIPRWRALVWVADELLDARAEEADRATVSGNGPHHATSSLLVLAGRLYKEAAASGGARIGERALRLLMDARNFTEAVQLIRAGREAVPRRLRALLAEALAGRGSLKDAEQLLEELLDEDDFSAAAGVARGFNLHEEYFKAQDIAERGANGGDVESAVLLGDLRRGAGDQTRVLDLYCLALAHGHPGARIRIERILAGDGTAWEHAQLRKYGLDPQGNIAPDWEVPAPGADDA
ncbi:tetratricopeptide repeat protein [Amycolatopsis dendrobii]|uniref:Tetratricopeptide repeat protein n=1 Tax=Amycolatopsis dendrobii TaxID=2760662 RepID=A0A7W3W0A7_9PSEU|nr:hypothetical protein [Amycolatopsis dendrobii]MBB1156498.1 hypothetical protein [Amycolatopsis dendrobii]